MGIVEWVKKFSLPKTEEECNALRTAEADAKPVQWNVNGDNKCGFFVPTDEVRLGMSKCSAEQMFDMSNNTCGPKVIDNSCGAGMYRASEGGECVDAPTGTFDKDTLVSMGECGGMTTENGSHSWMDGSCSLSCNEGFNLNTDGISCDTTEEETEGFNNRMRNLSDRDVMILGILVGLIYMYRKEIKKAFSK